MSWFQVCGFIATIRSTPPRRPRWPLSLIRTSNQVGRPWMFDGKMFRELAGTPIRRIDLANSPFALADPEPLTLVIAETVGAPTCVSDAIGSALSPRIRHYRESTKLSGRGMRGRPALHR